MVNVKDVQLGTTTRKSFAKINEVMDMPNLIEVQKDSYKWFVEEGKIRSKESRYQNYLYGITSSLCIEIA